MSPSGRAVCLSDSFEPNPNRTRELPSTHAISNLFASFPQHVPHWSASITNSTGSPNPATPRLIPRDNGLNRRCLGRLLATMQSPVGVVLGAAIVRLALLILFRRELFTAGTGMKSESVYSPGVGA